MTETRPAIDAAALALPEAAAGELRFRNFFGYWQRCAPAGRLPGRQHVDPLDIPAAVLPYIALYDIVPHGEDFRVRCRLVGTGVVELLGTDNTGRFLDETMTPDAYRPLHDSYRTVCRGEPQYWQRILPYANRSFTAVTRLALPLATDGARVDMVISCYLAVVGEAGPDRP